MILVCPNCAARYEVDGTKFPAEGRKVRCAKCGTSWHQAGIEPEPEPERAEIEAEIFEGQQPEPQAEEPEPPRARRAPEPDDDVVEDAPKPNAKKRSWGGLVTAIGWVALIAVILVIGWSAANYRSQIVGAWPQSASLFSHLGMGVNTRGLDFADVRHMNQTEDGQPVLVITGKLVNVSTKKLSVPPLRVTLSDENRHAIYDWSFAPTAASLAPGQTVPFRTRLSNPPSGARHVDIRFADGAE